MLLMIFAISLILFLVYIKESEDNSQSKSEDDSLIDD